VAASEAEAAYIGGEVESGMGEAESASMSGGVGEEEEEEVDEERTLDSRP
jgi:hypothetical protein